MLILPISLFSQKPHSQQAKKNILLTIEFPRSSYDNIVSADDKDSAFDIRLIIKNNTSIIIVGKLLLGLSGVFWLTFGIIPYNTQIPSIPACRADAQPARTHLRRRCHRRHPSGLRGEHRDRGGGGRTARAPHPRPGVRVRVDARAEPRDGATTR